MRRQAVDHVSATTDDGCTVLMTLGEAEHQLTARQADALAQGLLMALLRAGLDVTQVPRTGGVVGVTRHDGTREALMFSDDTFHGPNQWFTYMGVCWLY